MKEKTSPIKMLIGGILALVIAMGIGRFSYTPIMPMMEEAKLLSTKAAGYLASSNYIGYFIGALLAGFGQWKNGKSHSLKLSLIINIITTIAMGFTNSYVLWLILRFLSGLTSGLVFVLSASIVLDYLVRKQRPRLSGFLYSGVGLGIFITGLVTEPFQRMSGWEAAWIGVGVIAFFFSIFTILWVRDKPPQETSHISEKNLSLSKNKSSALKWLIASYGLEGIGYIICGTFLVALVQDMEVLSSFPSISWVIVGLAAIPSTIIWTNATSKWGNIRTLIILFFLQMIGVLLPVIVENTIGALVGSFLFGFTFMGITSVTITTARSLIPHQSSRIISYLTSIYGLGQIIGPTVAALVISFTNSYHASFILAGIVLFAGIICLLISRYYLSITSNQDSSLYEKA